MSFSSAAAICGGVVFSIGLQGCEDRSHKQKEQYEKDAEELQSNHQLDWDVTGDVRQRLQSIERRTMRVSPSSLRFSVAAISDTFDDGESLVLFQVLKSVPTCILLCMC